MDKEKKLIAIILTCFNRKNKTLKCLESLEAQKFNEKIDIYICDDCSTDGTAEEIKKKYPAVKLVKGTGHCYWTRGMYRALSAAVKVGYDYYLMVNDDVEFYPTMLQTMFDMYRNSKEHIGVVGATQSAITGEKTYGGVNIKKKFARVVYIPVDMDATVRYCDVANWNCFLIDSEIMNSVGLIDKKYEHGIADFDYCLMMKKKGYRVKVALNYVGTCERNSNDNTCWDRRLSVKHRIKKLLAPNGQPIKSQWHFFWKHFGISGIPCFLNVYLTFILYTMHLKEW